MSELYILVAGNWQLLELRAMRARRAARKSRKSSGKLTRGR